MLLSLLWFWVMNTLRLRHVLLKWEGRLHVVIVTVSRDFRFNYYFLIRINTRGGWVMGKYESIWLGFIVLVDYNYVGYTPIWRCITGLNYMALINFNYADFAS